jgi:hypothetical protein
VIIHYLRFRASASILGIFFFSVYGRAGAIHSINRRIGIHFTFLSIPFEGSAPGLDQQFVVEGFRKQARAPLASAR